MLADHHSHWQSSVLLQQHGNTKHRKFRDACHELHMEKPPVASASPISYVLPNISKHQGTYANRRLIEKVFNGFPPSLRSPVASAIKRLFACFRPDVPLNAALKTDTQLGVRLTFMCFLRFILWQLKVLLTQLPNST